MNDTGCTLQSPAMPSCGAATGTPTTSLACSTSTTIGLTTTTTTLASADPSIQHLDDGHTATEGQFLVEGIPQDPAKARQASNAKPKTAAEPPGAAVESGKNYTKQEFVAKQFNEAKYHEGQTVQKVTCACGTCMPLRFAYKCLYCGQFYCQTCAEEHFGKTREQYNAERKAEVNE